jgi:hypothetical protein
LNSSCMGWEALKNTLICQKGVRGDLRSRGIAINSAKKMKMEGRSRKNTIGGQSRCKRGVFECIKV